MFPHSNILVYKDGVKVEKSINSKLLKADIRDELRIFFEVSHFPNEDLQLELE